MTTRIARRFAELKEARRAALIPFLCGGDPDAATFARILAGLPAAGADLVEIGMPFSDPMADGPAIQAGNLRALSAGMTLPRLIEVVRRFREHDAATPLVLMGYYNPIHAYGRMRFLEDAAAAGIDGLIVVDLPPEEDEELCLPALAAGLDFVKLATPTTDERRLEKVLEHASGFLYYVSITGITGAAKPDLAEVGRAVEGIRRHTELPVAVGFGVRAPEQAAAIAQFADAAVVGSSLVDMIKDAGDAREGLVEGVHARVRALAQAVHEVRRP